MMTNAFADQNLIDLNNTIETPRGQQQPVLRKFCATLQPGRSVYDIRHGLGSVDVIVQTRIAGRVREGGISIVDANGVRLTFGGTLNEPLDVVIIG
jgi:hypothetical protein